MVRDLSCGDLDIYLELEVRRVDCGRCGKVKRERLTWLADNPFYTKRFAFLVGRRCRASTIKDVAKEVQGLLASEWVILGHFRPFLRGKTELLMSCRSVTISRWQNYDGVKPSGMRIASPALCRR